MTKKKTLGELLEWTREMAEKAEQRERLPGETLPRERVQLPLWPEPVRAVPNGFLRSALFGAIGKGRRRFVKAEKLATLENLNILLTGELFDQGDLDVYETILHVVRLQELGSQCRVTSYALLKIMGKTDTGKNRATLHERITRLRGNTVEIKQGRYTYLGGLIHEAAKDEETGEWVIELNPRLRVLFAPDQFTQIAWATRRALDGKQLAQWLHGFYASHAAPYPVKVETLHRLCGSEAVVMSDFAKALRKALDAVAEASAANGEIFSYEIRGDLVYVEKHASRSQRRHLAKKAASTRKPRG